MAIATTAGPLPIEGRRTEPIYIWSAIGIFFLLLQIYVYGGWILSEDFKPSNPGTDVMPAYTAFLAVFFQFSNVALAIGVLAYAVRTCRREGRVTIALLFVLAWLTTLWVDPLANYFRLVYTYNSHMINFGSWANFVPGWVMPRGNLIAEPVVFLVGAYVSIIPLQCWFMAWTMRLAKARWPGITTLGLVGICFLGGFTTDLIIEGAWVRMGLYVFSGTVHSWSLFGGEWYQFPLYNSIFWGGVLTMGACLWYFRDDKGQTFVEVGMDRISSPVTRNFLRFAAIAAVLNISYLLFAIAMGIVSFQMDTTPALPSYLTNEICGAGTPYPCPGPEVHVPLPESGPLQ